MTFEWPSMLWLLLFVPLVAGYYLRLARARGTSARRAYPGFAADVPPRGFWHRHGPPALVLLGLAAMILAIARPHAVLVTPVREETIILAMDVSGSMRADDVKPSRLAAAQAAAKAFVEKQPRHVRIGIVAFAGTAALVQSPTSNREELVQAIDRFQLQRGTAIGSALVISLVSLLPDSGIDVERVLHGMPARSRWAGPGIDGTGAAEAFVPVPPGSNGAMAIVLLTDGQSNTGADPLEAVKLAAERGVRVHTVGVGTPEGAKLGFEGWAMRVRLDEEALRKIAGGTLGEYYRAGDAQELVKIYESLSARFALSRSRMTEVSALFVALGVLLAASGALVSLLRHNRIV